MNKEDVEYDSDEQEEREKLRKEKEEMKDGMTLFFLNLLKTSI